ncbi:CHAP domain-containing protein [Sphingomonas sp. ID1715]|uniref:CHAP domain-containing protein n=1 Tax=Sphingomonas sp. ID1715 TaxID=1656898 RepID=UPI0020C477D6|nr:CHAP domain-containing protein [Sphingomonas sp. ID1715]
MLASFFGATPASAQFWQCAPFARMVSGIEIYGNAGTWWGQAAGRYDRGQTPQVGSVMVMKPHAKMRVGHVAMVSGIVSDREIKVTHANWSRRGGVERDVRVVDVSDAGDWSRVKVWYASMGDVGQTTYPTFGFVYAKSPASQFASLKGGANPRAALR